MLLLYIYIFGKITILTYIEKNMYIYIYYVNINIIM
jgi:hypothetical protein